MNIKREARGERREGCTKAWRDSSAYRLSPIAPGLSSAFSLIEVMVALAIFFMAVFAILGLMSTLLQNARIFQKVKPPEARMVFVYETSTTNNGTLGTKEYDFSEMADFGDQYRDYSARVVLEENETYTNGLCDMTCIVINRRTGREESFFFTHVYYPNVNGKRLNGVTRR
ncbi:MAG: prepilin-type N-terminal cleavage/methylation domain-containing protein [Verrucomicrobiales bacterium]|nr:MAG: prepilin-type N-terminal cleavage/methylation domain-containing protein [Verrucomicrobiales bacterium]